MISPDIIDRIREADLVSIIEGEGIELKRSGTGYQCCCPFHQEKTPSFTISPSRNLAHCFGSCGKSYDAIGFIQERRGMTFYESVRYLAGRLSIPFEEKEETPDEREARFRRETLMNINLAALAWFRDRFKSAPAAKEYCMERGWSEETVETYEIGFAPAGGGLSDHLFGKGYKEKDLLDAGVLKRNEETFSVYEAFRERIIFPLYDDSGRLCGFTGRYIGPRTDVPKYMNTADTELYSKSKILFGLRQASRQIGATRQVVLCEGNPDVIRLSQIGVLNAVAPCGTALTDQQIHLLSTKARSVLYLGDMDPSGEKAVIKNAPRLIAAGLDVRVMRWNPDLGKDPDEYFKKRPKGYADALAECVTDFLPWYHTKRMAGVNGLAEATAAISDICTILASMKDAVAAESMLDTFRKDRQYAKIWTAEFYKAKNASDRAKALKDEKSQDMLKEFGFYIKNNCYYGAGSGTSDRRWSNFIMEPILHIRDERNAKRIYLVKNDRHDEAVVKLAQSEMVSFSDFRTRTETAGNFVWEASAAELTKLKMYLYDNTPSAEEIRQLGWQKRFGFFAWGNGGMDEDGHFYKADRYGLVQIGDKKYYFPGCAADTLSNTAGYLAERQFVYAETNRVTLKEYTQKLVSVFGDNAKVGLCFLLATLFRDITSQANNGFFPLLLLFGPKGTGKSVLGNSLSRFFFDGAHKPANISSGTKAALAEAVAEVSNAIVHLDEMKRDVEVDKYEILKGIYDGTGRTRINIDNEKRREMTAVDAGVIISGQEMPTADIALFSRTIYLTFSKTIFTDAERRQFEDLKLIEGRGLTHLTAQLLRLRSKVMSGYRSAFDATKQDLLDRVRSYNMEDRTLNNWAILLAAFRTVESYIDFPFDYQEILKLCADLCVRQNTTTRENSELSGFWEAVETLSSSSKAWINVDYRIVEGGKRYRTAKGTYIETNPDRRFLLFNFKRIASLYLLENRQTGVRTIPKDSLKYYLEKSPEYLGMAEAVKFRKLAAPNSGADQSKAVTTTAMIFDYDALCHNYEINLDILASAELDDDAAPVGAVPPPVDLPGESAPELWKND